MDEDEHDNHIKQKTDKNLLPEFVVKPEDLYDLKDRRKKVNN